MRLVVLSGIHGNLPALQAVLDDLAQARPDGFILAGDYTGCPQAVETIQHIPDDIWERAGRSFDREGTAIGIAR